MDDISKGRRISFLPSLDTTYFLWYKYRLVTVTRTQTTDGPWHKRKNLKIRYVDYLYDSVDAHSLLGCLLVTIICSATSF